ncbi:hypothetical protein [Endozoicomonas acroporae]|uniref:hypothetical protein n=1 Tax=Endozoicomonas acroporae TaxID=1701104 RepID=UPI0013D3FEC7|nr:hypothetical protein [Endozoicomonas acroporae]
MSLMATFAFSATGTSCKAVFNRHFHNYAPGGMDEMDKERLQLIVWSLAGLLIVGFLANCYLAELIILFDHLKE